MSQVELTVIASRTHWPRVKELVDQYHGKMGAPTSLTNPAEAPNFPIEILNPDFIKHGLEFVDIILRDGRDAILMVLALRELLGKNGQVLDRNSGKMYELPPETPPPIPMVKGK
jgi:hypothetical protein